ncbi:uncharacterized protein A4U43_C08F34420 [Asparagus officinalis]|uniref:V-type proton ATPase subunit a1-like n=1 Tax=Asparagus officinalis TaxID=4686 RepID=UPI00098E1E48|nr:V-type proton ATPase subunit a1-like [Asparagus officinalis]ONK61869.1 uncharacterized protein A4U43_C08F34420 [Asparagus officinalis]
MSLVQFIIPVESAHKAISYIGEFALVQFRDVKRCGEMSRKLRYFTDQISKAGLTCSALPALQPKPEDDLEDLEVQLGEHEAELLEMNSKVRNYGKLTMSYWNLS